MLALGEPLVSRSPLANVLLRDGDGIPGTHKSVHTSKSCSPNALTYSTHT
jgi:hypothetical protein